MWKAVDSIEQHCLNDKSIRPLVSWKKIRSLLLSLLVRLVFGDDDDVFDKDVFDKDPDWLNLGELLVGVDVGFVFPF